MKKLDLMANLESKHRVGFYGGETWFEIEPGIVETRTVIVHRSMFPGEHKTRHTLPWPLSPDELRDLHDLIERRLEQVESRTPEDEVGKE